MPHELDEAALMPQRTRVISQNQRRAYAAFTTLVALSFSVTLLLALFTPSGFAKTPTCSPIGGAILTNLGGFGQIDGTPTTMGLATGDLKGAVGVTDSQRQR